MIQLCHHQREVCRDGVLSWESKYLSFIAISQQIEILHHDQDIGKDLATVFDGLALMTILTIQGVNTLEIPSAMRSYMHSAKVR